MEPDYPRPLLRRKSWYSLNGHWDFALDPDQQWSQPDHVGWSGGILVPFAPETPKSGIGFHGFSKAFWYRREFEAPEFSGCLMLHFEAVDYRATVWVNGQEVTRHEGGYVPFSCDITRFLRPGVAQELAVRAEDDPADLSQPRGKQDWQLNPHSIWYPRTSGIWGTVWLEPVPDHRIERLCWSSNRERWEIGLDLRLNGSHPHILYLDLCLSANGGVLAADRYAVHNQEVSRRILLSDPGIDDFRNELLWRPERPTLIEAHLALTREDGTVVDEVESYTALRSIAIQGNRCVLNGSPVKLQMILDQGYWPETGLTPPDGEALRHDVELVKAMGFNCVRKHQKIEDRRYLYWADVLGLLVWEEMPSAYRYTRDSIQRFVREWLSVLERDSSHPCIIAWVPFNESWGVPDLPDSAAQRHYVQAMYHLTKTIDTTRPVVGNDGWESVATDIIGIHDYDSDPDRIAMRYGDHDAESRLLARERPGGRLLVLNESGPSAHPLILSEFGGIAFSPDQRAWGYSRCANAEEFVQRFRRLLFAVRASPLLAGYCYTQFADTYQEANGLLTADRRPKIPLAEIAQVNCDMSSSDDGRQNSLWRSRLMELQRHIAKLTEEG